MQGLPADEHQQTRPQSLYLPTSSPGEPCPYDCTECRLVRGGGPADHSASYHGEVAYAGANQQGHLQEKYYRLEQYGTQSGGRRRLAHAASDLAHALHLPHCQVPSATRSPLCAWC